MEAKVDNKFTDTILQTDLGYVIKGIECHTILNSICPPKYGLQILEPGCGSGKLGTWYALRGAAVTLLDINPEALVYAKRLWQLARDATPTENYYGSTLIRYVAPSFKQGSIHKLPFPDGSFDFVFNEGVSCHFGRNSHDWRRQHSINEMVRVAKEGGHVCVIGSNAHCLAKVAIVEKNEYTYPGMPKKEKPFTVEELVSRLEKAGLKDIYIAPALQFAGELSGGRFTLPDNPFALSALIAGWGTKK